MHRYKNRISILLVVCFIVSQVFVFENGTALSPISAVRVSAEIADPDPTLGPDVKVGYDVTRALPANAVDLALNQKVAASGFTFSGQSPEKAVDGDMTWYWCTTNAGEKWMYVDFLEKKNVNRWVVKHSAETTATTTRGFKLQYSDDAMNWTDVDTVINNSALKTDRLVQSFRARYVRLYITQPTQLKNGTGAARIVALSLYFVPNVCDRVKIYPRAGYADRVVGAKIRGSNVSTTTNYDDLFTFTVQPAENQWTEYQFPNTLNYRWLKYYSSPTGYANIAELQFYDGTIPLMGTGFGTVGSNGGNSFEKALDGNVTTYFDWTDPNDGYVGIDTLNPDAKVTDPQFSIMPMHYFTAQPLDISTSYAGASIRYTTDGTEPTSEHGIVYTTTIALTQPVLIKAIAYKAGSYSSDVIAGYFSIGPNPPIITPFTTLHIGNSLTDTLKSSFAAICLNLGVNNKTKFLTVPGANAKYIWENNLQQIKDHLASEPIDYMSLQINDGFLYENTTIQNYSDLAYSTNTNPNLKLLIYGQWPYSSGTDYLDQQAKGTTEWHPTKGVPADWYSAVFNKVEFLELLKKTYETNNPGKVINIMPEGLALAALQNAVLRGEIEGMKTTDEFYKFIFADSAHLTAEGAYLVGLVTYICLYHSNPTGRVNPLGTKLTLTQAAQFQDIAWRVVTSYAYSGAFVARDDALWVRGAGTASPTPTLTPTPSATPIPTNLLQEIDPGFENGTVNTRPVDYIANRDTTIRIVNTTSHSGTKSAVLTSIATTYLNSRLESGATYRFRCWIKTAQTSPRIRFIYHTATSYKVFIIPTPVTAAFC